MIRKAAYLLVLICAGLLAVVAFNTLRARSKPWVAVPRAVPAVNLDAAAQRLAGAVRIRTVSVETPSEESRRELPVLHAYLETSFPRAHAVLRRELVNDYSLLYTWTGRDSTAKPIVLMAHQDVVPIAPGSEAQWHAGPFSGEIRDGFVWGRGAWDDKGNLMAILEAVEALAAAGFAPERTVYLAFGHDEENGGTGAQAIAALFRQRGVHPGFVLDEGLLIADGIIPGLDAPVALIGIAEKGWATVRLTATAVPGHSSMPGRQTAIGSLADALHRLDREPFPAAVRGVSAQMFETLAPDMHGVNKIALTNLWLLGPLVRWQLAQSPSTDALQRTTQAITVIRGGDKENVLPASADALVNFRLLPGETVAGVLEHVRDAVRDSSVHVEVLPGAREASSVSSVDSPAYGMIARAARAVAPGVLVAPGLLVGATDSRSMVGIADDVYRFSPVRAGPEDLARFHGTDERISVDNYAELIRFYETLITDAASGR
jgi:carboxypeptidase PM20D1